jgi:hypothetical protein
MMTSPVSKTILIIVFNAITGTLSTPYLQPSPIYNHGRIKLNGKPPIYRKLRLFLVIAAHKKDKRPVKQVF